MSNMVLGAYTFAVQPADIPGLMDPDKAAAHVKTYGPSVQYFEWGTPSMLGKVISLVWDKMPTSMYNQLRTLYEAVGPYTWNPQKTDGHTFTVHILPGFPGKSAQYHVTLEDTLGGEETYRKNVQMDLLIMAVLS
jgi:hypothetical protein